METEGDDEVGDNTAERDALAEKLASLSEGETPNGFTSVPSPFDSAQVDWSSNGWLANVEAVQLWLQLDGPLTTSNGAEAFLVDIFGMLGAEEPSACFLVKEGHAQLNDFGITLLGARLDQAIEFKELFAESLSEGMSRNEATNAWTSAWDEVPSATTDNPVDVSAKVDSWQIFVFVARAAEDGLDLNPSYQRGTVWSDKESSELIDSVMRGIPLPSIILNQRKGSEILEIVDGKQRLTAILRFIGRHPDALAFVDLVDKENAIESALFHSDYRKWRAAVKKKRGLTGDDERKNFLPFAYRVPRVPRKKDPLAEHSGSYFTELKDKKVRIQNKDETVQRLFQAATSSYKLSVILYEDTDVNQIHRVFGLYNRQGKKLNATEVRNAIYHHLPLARLLLLLAGDNENRALATYLSSGFDLGTVPNLLEAMNVSDSRFNRTKITSWVAAILLHRLDEEGKATRYPGSTSFIESMLATISSSHPMSKTEGCNQFATDVERGAALLSELRDMEAFYPRFTHPSSPGERWEDLPAVASWTACTLAGIAGVVATPEIRAAVLEVTKATKRLEKQQARSQWQYLSRVSLELLGAMEVDPALLGGLLQKRFGYNCLEALNARRN